MIAVSKKGLTFLFCLMSQHRSKGDIPDAFDTLDGGVELVVNNDSALVILLDTDCLEV
jgi:hypothetical protein